MRCYRGLGLSLPQWPCRKEKTPLSYARWGLFYANGSKSFGRRVSKVFSEPVPVFYDGDCIFCQRVSRVLRSLDILKRLRFVNFRIHSHLVEFPGFDALRAEREIGVRSRGEEWFYGYDAFKYIAWKVPLFWIFAWAMYLPGISFLGRRLYSWV